MNVSENFSITNQTGQMQRGVRYPLFQPSLIFSIVWFLYFPIACMSALFNPTVLWAIAKVNKSQLRAKYFIQNLCVANLIIPMTNLVTPFIVALIFEIPNLVLACYSGFFSLTVELLYFAQPMCALVLTVDRVYAIFRPLIYNTVGYPKFAVTVLVGLPWFTGILFTLSFFVSQLTSGEEFIAGFPQSYPLICTHVELTFDEMESTASLSTYIIVSYTIVFVGSIVVLSSLKYQQRSIKSISASSANRKNDFSLATTYLLLNTTSFLCFLPSPIYNHLVGHGFKDREEIYFLIRVSLVILYQCNSFMDPLILLRRVPSIRHNWNLIWNKKTVLTSLVKSISLHRPKKQVLLGYREANCRPIITLST